MTRQGEGAGCAGLAARWHRTWRGRPRAGDVVHHDRARVMSPRLGRSWLALLRVLRGEVMMRGAIAGDGGGAERERAGRAACL